MTKRKRIAQESVERRDIPELCFLRALSRAWEPNEVVADGYKSSRRSITQLAAGSLRKQ